ncbi:geranylgeranyl reductase family protein [Frankia sp. B2]|uniref:geranylgeranyl reductase family protein n=1 Tax=unclassified Frankia TaxID=2632575 RepID=UPI000460B14B|nr:MULTISPECIES: geranylgeranyl reductase family protein [unclassified Frankia]KDA44135.1 flavin-dependent dehydrogenase [Frankia sp. BMG5.23]TFE34026.1 geranylgeranyl reductase family protein [Frankia sp. B2]
MSRVDDPENTFDVIVVGAGPAGGSAARAAANAGARVCVLERSAVPRYKTCGGGLVGLSADHLGIELAGLVRASVSSLTMTWDGRFEVTRGRSGGRPWMSMVMRSDLDAALLAAAAAAGATVRTGAHVVGLTESGPGGTGIAEDAGDQDDGWVTVRLRAGADLRARVVVGADGTSGRCGTYVGVRCDQVDVGLEGEFVADPARAARWAGRMLIDWGPVPGSYGWVFPKGRVLTVGVIGDRAEGAALRAYYTRFVDRLGLTDLPRQHDSGHLTRVRAVASPLRRGRVLVAGDAAGLLDPWTREGISFALRSGRLAGEAAAAASVGVGRARAGVTRAGGVTDTRPTGPGATALDALAAYPARVEAILGPEMAAGREVLAAFTRRPGAMHTVMAAPGTFGLFTRLIEGRTTIARQLRRPGVRAAVAALRH